MVRIRVHRQVVGMLLAGGLLVGLLTGCGSLRRAVRGSRSAPAQPSPTAAADDSPAAPSPQPSSPAPPEATATTGADAPAEPEAAPTLPPLETMTFIERNTLYLEILAEKQADGADTTEAEELYIQSVEATLNGDTTAADTYLNEAILALLEN